MKVVYFRSGGRVFAKTPYGVIDLQLLKQIRPDLDSEYFLGGLFSGLKSIGTGVWNGFKSLGSGALNLGSNLLSNVGSTLGSLVSNVGTNLGASLASSAFSPTIFGQATPMQQPQQPASYTSSFINEETTPTYSEEEIGGNFGSFEFDNFTDFELSDQSDFDLDLVDESAVLRSRSPLDF